MLAEENFPQQTEWGGVTRKRGGGASEITPNLLVFGKMPSILLQEKYGGGGKGGFERPIVCGVPPL